MQYSHSGQVASAYDECFTAFYFIVWILIHQLVANYIDTSFGAFFFVTEDLPDVTDMFGNNGIETIADHLCAAEKSLVFVLTGDRDQRLCVIKKLSVTKNGHGIINDPFGDYFFIVCHESKLGHLIIRRRFYRVAVHSLGGPPPSSEQ